MINAELIRRVVKHIENNPKTWDQEHWGYSSSCGTTFCMAGHTVVMSGHTLKWADDGDGRSAYYVENGEYISDKAQELLGLNDEQAEDLFSAYSTSIQGYKEIITEITGVTFDE